MKRRSIAWGLCCALFVLALVFAPVETVVAQEIDPPPGAVVPVCEGPCGYCDLVTLAENVVDWLVYLAVIAAILMIVYAGFLYLTAGSNSGQITKAHSVFRVTVMGLVLTLAAWLIINLIMTTFFDAEFADWGTLPGC